MAKRSAMDRYHSKLAEAQAIAKDAARDLEARAQELVSELNEVRSAYEAIMGSPMSEPTGRTGARSGRRKASSSSKPARRKRKGLSGAYAGMTIPDAVVAALKKHKSGLGPREIADTIGGNKNSISVAINGMVKDGTIKRAGRGVYVAG
ncbi:MAG: hypothetical protein H6812_04460 [Phycisphaeraceae bacterium]|nr:hypothetical protein [Phycisphaerales bacterium]MCB9842490.1 hypothetical protein [Phycisphaeraceae bacterium]